MKIKSYEKKKQRDVQKKIEVRFSLQVFTHKCNQSAIWAPPKEISSTNKNQVVAKNVEEYESE